MKTKENVKKSNFTKLTRSGISLIVLVITIIVIIILAAAVILTINNNNPVVEANTARYESDCANMQAIFTNAVAKVMAKNQATLTVSPGQINTITGGVSEIDGHVAYTLTDAQNESNATGTIVFDKKANTDTIFYTGKKLPIYAAGETKWYVDSEGNISLEVAGTKYGSGDMMQGEGGGNETTGSASLVANDPTTYYGQKVTNYTTGNTAIDQQVDWQIYYSDSNNIYLIATDYVHYDLLPKKKVIAEDGTETEYALNRSTNYKANFSNILPAYNGSEDIIGERIQALNKSYHEYLITNNTLSKNDNMKSVAYMLDIDIWDKFAGNKAEYAIGGPTVEMLMESYSQKYSEEGIDYRAEATSKNGYKISVDDGTSWTTYSIDVLNKNDTQYVIKSLDRANYMWLASPSSLDPYSIMCVDCDGGVYSLFYNYSSHGFRPLVCLDSSVSLKEVTGGYEIE